MLSRHHPCQLSGEVWDDDEDDEVREVESAEYEYVILDTALDVVIGLATALGETFMQLWKMFEKPVMKYASSSDPVERSTAVGVIAEVIRETGPAITPSTTSLLKLLLHRLSDEDSETKANAAYAIGLLQEKSQNALEIVKVFPTILANLEPMLQTEHARVVDNAAGCVSRMILSHQEHVPINLVIPALIKLLPLKEDYQENEPVWAMMVQLCKDFPPISPLSYYLLLLAENITDKSHLIDSANEPIIVSLTPQLLPILSSILSPPEEQLNDKTRDQVIQMVKYIFAEDKFRDDFGKYEQLIEVFL